MCMHICKCMYICPTLLNFQQLLVKRAYLSNVAHGIIAGFTGVTLESLAHVTKTPLH